MRIFRVFCTGDDFVVVPKLFSDLSVRVLAVLGSLRCLQGGVLDANDAVFTHPSGFSRRKHSFFGRSMRACVGDQVC